MTHSELLEQHEGRLRLYMGLLDGMSHSPDGEEARQTILELVRKEISAADHVAQLHLRRLSGENEREAFRYAMSLLLPYYTHLARLYGRQRRSRAAA